MTYIDFFLGTELKINARSGSRYIDLVVSKVGPLICDLGFEIEINAHGLYGPKSMYVPAQPALIFWGDLQLKFNVLQWARATHGFPKSMYVLGMASPKSTYVPAQGTLISGVRSGWGALISLAGCGGVH